MCKVAAGKCAGCGKTGAALKHCLAHCTKYLEVNVAGKAGIVTKANACVICLHPNHTTDQCYDKDNPKRVFGLDGCSGHHHPRSLRSNPAAQSGYQVWLTAGARHQ